MSSSLSENTFVFNNFLNEKTDEQKGICFLTFKVTLTKQMIRCKKRKREKKRKETKSYEAEMKRKKKENFTDE